MLKKMKTRKGTDGYNYPYTHQDLIFNDEGTGLSQQLESFATKDFVNDSISNAQLNNGSGSSVNQDLSEIRTELEKKANKSDLKAVATSGSYNDLTNKPSIPSIQGLATEDFVNNMLSGLRLVQMTQSEYDALEVKDSNTLYIII